MNSETLIAPALLRDYAKAQGWTLLKDAAKDRLYVMSNPRFGQRQLVFPMDTTAPDYAEAITLVVEKLATMEQRPIESVVKSLMEAGDDAVAFRITSPSQEERYLPLSLAGEMISGAQQLLLASACTVLKPKAHHPRLSRTEAQQFLETARFHHTQPGSFVLNVSCPVHAMDVKAPLLPNETDAPFVRRAMVTFQRSLRELISNIETDSLPQLVESLKKSDAPLISANFCEALTRFEDASLKNSVDIAITWATALPRPEDEPVSTVVRVQHDYFSRIEAVRRELRSDEKHMDDTFIATVEQLNGEMGEDGLRSGEVILSVFLSEGEQVRARTNLTAEQYATADKAHMTDGTYVRVTGKLHPGRQPRQLSDLRAFGVIEFSSPGSLKE
jgi:hypothetical protein